MKMQWHISEMSSSRLDLAKPINNRMILMEDALMMFFLEEEDVEYFKEHADDFNGIQLNPIAVGVRDLDVFRKNLEEVVKYVIFDNQRCVDSVTMTSENPQIYAIMKDVCEKNRTYISDRYIYWPEVKNVVFNNSLLDVDGTLSEDEYRSWFLTISRSITEVKELLAVDTIGGGGSSGGMGGDSSAAGPSAGGGSDSGGQDIPVPEEPIDIHYPDLPEEPEDGYFRWEEMPKEEDGGDGGGDEGGEGGEDTSVTYLLYAVAYKYVYTINMKGMFSRMMGKLSAAITTGNAAATITWWANPEDPGVEPPPTPALGE
jgi:hypothetical protein